MAVKSTKKAQVEEQDAKVQEPSEKADLNTLMGALNQSLSSHSRFDDVLTALDKLGTRELEELAEMTKDASEYRKKKERIEQVNSDPAVIAFKKKYKKIKEEFHQVNHDHKVDVKLNVPLIIEASVRLKGGCHTELNEIIDPHNQHIAVYDRAGDWRDVVDVYSFDTGVEQTRSINDELVYDLETAAEKVSREWCEEGKLRVLSKKLDRKFIGLAGEIYDLRQQVSYLLNAGYKFEYLIEE